MNPDLILYSGEAQLAGWSDTHSGGAKLVLWLPDAKGLEPFRAMTARKGGTAGQVLMLAVAEVGEDGQPVPQPRRQQALSEVAALLCGNSDFWRWWGEEYGTEPASPDDCAAALRTRLGIESRAELDTDDDAALRFHNIIRRPFVAWQRTQ